MLIDFEDVQCTKGDFSFGVHHETPAGDRNHKLDLTEF